jgi:hypothetical protein
MKPVEDQLLESLAGGVRPFDVLPAQVPVDTPDFDAMLEDAIDGRAATGLGVRFAPAASGIFDQEEQSVIARSIDLVAASGVEHALILHKQRTLRVDVRNRVVLDVDPITEQTVIDGIDGFVAAKVPKVSAELSNPSDARMRLNTPARGVRNASLVHALAGRVPNLE